jgi:hypothetical protein
MKFYVESPDMFSYLGLKFQVNRILERHQNMGQQRLYEFYYLLPFDLWTFYLARILFVKGCGNLFWKSTNYTKIFNGLQHSFQVWQGFIIISESFFFFGKLTYVLKEEDTNIIRGIPQIYNDNRNIKHKTYVFQNPFLTRILYSS